MTETRGAVVPLVPFEEMSTAFQARAKQAIAHRGVAINSLHAFANADALGGATRDYFAQVAAITSLSPELRLVIRLAVASANECRYCMAHQRLQLAGLGMSDAKIAAISRGGEGMLDARESAAVRFAKSMTIDAGNIPEDVYADFVACFTPRERVEVAIVAGAMGMMNKLNDSLRIPLESEFARFADW